MMRIHLLVVGMLAVILVTLEASADVIEIGASKDNTLYESLDGSLSNGEGLHIIAGRTGQGSNFLRRALLAFDVAGAIPAGSTINSAQLQLNLSRTRFSTNQTVSLHRVLADWGEGTSDASGGEGTGAPATTGDATWIHTFHDTELWSTAGGDRSGTSSATASVGGLGFYTWGSTADMLSDVQMWLDSPGMNFGWMLIGNESVMTTAKRFDSRDHFTEANRPLLTIDFTPPAEVGACCDDLLGGCGEDIALSICLSNGGRFGGDGSTCADLDPPCQPSGACCDELAGDCTDLVVAADCATPGLRYGGDASTCDALDPPCLPLPTGACCLEPNGVCVDGFTINDCGANSGRYGGDGSTCASIDPPCRPATSVSLELVAGGVPAAAAAGEVGTGLTAPVYLTHAGDGSGRLFVVDQIGQIRVIENDVLLPTPFLDLTATIVSINPFFDERGLLGLAFHPDYANNGRFFVRYSAPRAGDPAEPCNDPDGFVVGCHEAILAEYAVSAGDPNVADAASEVILFRIDEPQFNHNAGQVLFGPDGLLYFTLGDGGGAHDGLADVPPSHGPMGHGQDIDTALGSLLRIDVGSADVLPDDFPGDSDRNYAIPPGNPFAAGGGAPEIYAYGFRNPYRFSFANVEGVDVAVVADVGQNLLEEIDFVPVFPTPGLLNYGWVIREGFSCFDPMDPTVPPLTCATSGASAELLIDPVVDYPHPTACATDLECAALGTYCNSEGFCANPAGIAVIGGFVYRGSGYPALSGKYFFGDFGQSFSVPGGRLFVMDVDGPQAFQISQVHLAPSGAPLGLALFGIGEDQAGELYVLAADSIGPSGNGFVFRVSPPRPVARALSPRYLEIRAPPSPDPLTLVVTPNCVLGEPMFVGPPSGADNFAKLEDFRTPLDSLQWGPVIRVFGTSIVPETPYLVQTDYGTAQSPALSTASNIQTTIHGDVAGLQNGAFTQPDGNLDFVIDVVAIVQAFSGLNSAPPLYQVDLARASASGIGCLPDQSISIIIDAIIGIDAFQGGDGSIMNCADPCP